MISKLEILAERTPDGETLTAPSPWELTAKLNEIIDVVNARKPRESYVTGKDYDPGPMWPAGSYDEYLASIAAATNSLGDPEE